MSYRAFGEGEYNVLSRSTWCEFWDYAILTESEGHGVGNLIKFTNSFNPDFVETIVIF